MSVVSASARINLSRARGRLVVTVQGDLDAVSAPALGDVLLAAAECEERTVVVDLAAVEFIDSSGLTVLLSGRRHLGRHGGRLVVTAPSPSVLRMFELTGLDRSIPIVRQGPPVPARAPRMFPPQFVPI